MAKEEELDPYEIVLYPFVSEKTLFQIDKKEENKLTFIVKRKATKPQIKEAIEKMYDVKVAKINTKISKEGKIAFVKLGKGYSAEELAMRIGIF